MPDIANGPLALSGSCANDNALKIIRQKKSPAYKVIAFKNTLLDLGIKPTSLYLVGEDIEIYLSSKSPYSPKIIFKKDFNLEAISENLQTALDAEPLKSNFKNKYASLEYIDLRYGNKVYYKFR